MKLNENKKKFERDSESGYLDFGEHVINCPDYSAKRLMPERLASSSVSTQKLGNGYGNGKMIKDSKPLFKEPPKLLRELVESNSLRETHFQLHNRSYNNHLFIDPIKASFVI